MKATIRDKAQLMAVRPLDLVAYLRANRWHETEHQEGRYAVWHRNGSHEPVEVLLPLNRDFRDYALRIADALQTLEIVEERSQLDILTDIQATTFDVVRIAAEDKALESGTIGLVGGVQFIDYAYQLVLAAACSTAQPQQVYHARRPKKATEYIDQARMGTDRGSFVVTVHAPMTPALRSTTQLSFISELEPPFARQVSNILMQALNTVRQAAERAVATGDFAPFLKSVEVGVSANLCDALVGLWEGSKAEQIRVRMSRSPLRTDEAASPHMVVIRSDAIPVIKEAGRLLRETAPRQDFQLQGFVVRLVKAERAKRGRVTVGMMVDDTYRNVQFDLEQEAYQLAIEAHKNRLPIECEGELVRENRQYVLRDPRNVAIIQFEPAEVG
jgi:hypothetical protein